MSTATAQLGIRPRLSPEVVLTDPAHLTADAISRIEAIPATVYPDLPTSKECVIERIGPARIAVTSFVRLDADVLGAAPNLEHLIVPASGYQGVDREFARSRGITVINTPTHNAHAVAEHAVGLMFAAARLITTANDSLCGGQWTGGSFRGIELSGRRLGMTTSTANSRSTPTEIDELVRQSDVVCLTLPLSDQTFHIMDERRLKMVGPQGLLINVSRGPVVDQVALYDLLLEGKIGGAGLDVFEGEPSVGDPMRTVSPEIIKLAKLPNVAATPHMGWNTIESNVRQGEELRANIQACLDGRPINVVSST